MAYLIKGAHVVDPQVGLDDVRDVLVEDKSIVEVAECIDAPDAEVIDGAGKYLVPGLVDMHVHFRDPGFEYKETIASGSRAAAHGGFTDVATMPNTDPVTDTGAEIRYQIDTARRAGLVHVRPMGALTRGEKGESLAEIGDMVMEGASAFSDDGHGVQSAGMMKTCMAYVSQFDRVVCAHCEVESLSKNGVINSGNVITATSHIRMEKDGQILDGLAVGDGPVDASFLAIEQIIGHHYELDDFQIQTVTEGRDAMGSALVKLRAGGRVYSGNGISTDIIGASIRAYISALNKIVYEDA